MTPFLDIPPTRSAVISDCGKYRYHLFRKVGQGARLATFVMLNPSSADHEVDDPTIRKVMGFAPVGLRRVARGQPFRPPGYQADGDRKGPRTGWSREP